jgi:cytochrome c-type biogenesis protein CcmH
MRTFFTLLILTLLISPAVAVEPEEMLSDPALEARARDISAELRCLVCQNQSIDDSDAQLAKDLRLLVRERLVKGETDEQVMAYIVSRYGEFVLLKPPFNSSTYVLWYGPVIFVMIGVLVVFVMFRRRQSPVAPAAVLNTDEKRRLEALLDDEGQS